ncbi:MAG: hypothetical protein AAGH70_11935 [Pseudomonadota bacterium]
MLKFLFGTKPGAAKAETQRDTFERLVKELNEAIVVLPQKPKVTVDPNTGAVSFEAPEHFPDEALALPKPAEAADAPAPNPQTDEAAATEDNQKAA